MKLWHPIPFFIIVPFYLAYSHNSHNFVSVKQFLSFIVISFHKAVSIHQVFNFQDIKDKGEYVTDMNWSVIVDLWNYTAFEEKKYTIKQTMETRFKIRNCGK